MTETQEKESKSLAQTFIPKQLLQKSSQAGLYNKTTILEKNVFEKVGGNIYLEIDPPEVKFAGYELNKVHTAQFKIINKAPIPQRVHILPPSELETVFTIKMNKKGAIPSGMSENVIVQFKSDVYKYQTDIIKINSETENFVVPIYAYPTIPRTSIRKVFPPLIDFGKIQVGQTQHFDYEIQNSVPLDFEYEFEYLKECQQIMITPLKGVIASNSTEKIVISFSPKSKSTYVAQAVFILKQFDFEPLGIKILGNGSESDKKKSTLLGSTKRVRSSRLAPLRPASKAQRERPKEESQPQQILPQQSFRKTKNQNQKPSLAASKRSFIRSSFPKLLASKRTQQLEGQTLNNQTLNPRKLEQKQYLSKYNRVQGLDKEKDIKFSEFLGDRAMTEDDLGFENQVREQINKARSFQLERRCSTSYQEVQSSGVQVQYQKLPQYQLSFNDNRNDELRLKRLKLERFMRAGTKVILQIRMLKRLSRIREFLRDCGGDRKKVAKKVNESYLKSLEVGFDNASKSQCNFEFDWSSLLPQSFPIFHKESDNSQKTSSIVFKPDGKSQFDDLTTLTEIQRDQVDAMKYGTINFPPDFVNFSKTIPHMRRSAEEEYALRSPSLPQFSPIKPTSVYQLPLKIPNHHFIYDDFQLRRFKSSEPIDEKDPQYLLAEDCQHQLDRRIEDQFEGWSKGEYQILKAKFMKNSGVQFLMGFEGYNGSGYVNDCAFLGKIDRYSKYQIEKSLRSTEMEEDAIDQGDSDEEKDPSLQPQTSQKLMKAYQSNDKKIQERRANPDLLLNVELEMRKKIDINLERIKQKGRSQWVDKAADVDKWAILPKNRLLI